MPPIRKRVPKRIRLSISLDRADHEALRALARGHKPELSLQYVINFAIQHFLQVASGDRELSSRLGDPTRRDG
jgi:hypothetical protein